jgi:hypothetical protein
MNHFAGWKKGRKTVLLFKYVVVLAGLGILAVAAALVLYDAALAVNFQGREARGAVLDQQDPEPVSCRPSVFLYQRRLAERRARLAEGRARRIRRRVRARRGAAMS